MKRKKQTSTSSSSSGAATTISAVTALISEHSLFFDKLIELIPAKFYLPNDDDSKPYFKGLSKIAKASMKQQTRENIKLSRRNRLDPEKIAQSSTLDLLKQSLNKPEEASDNDDNDDDDDNDEEREMGPIDEEDKGNESVTYEALRQRLRRKIELLKGNRGGEKSITKKISGENKSRGLGGGEEKKRKRGDEDEKVIAEGVVEKGIEFGKVKIGDEEKRKKRKVPKGKALEKATRLEEMKRENPSVAEKESWKAATSRAYGARVHDDPKQLKQSIKKEQRKRVKSAEQWKERGERIRKMKSDRQKKRTVNIGERAKDKKDRKIAKREKKLMRPGFEGRKEGYITKT